MHYIYMLDGLLKNESIDFEDSITFVLRNNSEKLLDDEDDFNDTIFYLKSNENFRITLDLDSELVRFSNTISGPVFITNKDGHTSEYSDISEISLNENDVKFAIPDNNLAFLMNTTTDPVQAEVKNELSVSSFSLLGFFSEHSKKLVTLCLFLIICSGGVYFIYSTPMGKKAVLFENETALMKVDVANFTSDEIVVKTQLLSRIRELLDEIGYKYIKVDLLKNNDKYDLVVYAFDDNIGNFESELKSNNISWINNLIVKKLNPQNMYEDFNVIAEKYNLRKKLTTTRKINYELVDLFLPNNNLRYNSIHKDLGAFYDRWGKNYIEFNVNLKENQSIPIDFIIDDGKQQIIKSGQGFYFN